MRKLQINPCKITINTLEALEKASFMAIRSSLGEMEAMDFSRHYANLHRKNEWKEIKILCRTKI